MALSELELKTVKKIYELLEGETSVSWNGNDYVVHIRDTVIGDIDLVHKVSSTTVILGETGMFSARDIYKNYNLHEAVGEIIDENNRQVNQARKTAKESAMKTLLGIA